MENRTITILHLSDVQFGINHRFGMSIDSFDGEWNTLLVRLKLDLNEMKNEHGLQPDLLVVSGDLSEWGMKSEFDLFLDFITKLSDHLGLRRERVVLVPGNHDINRKHCSSYFDECAGNGERPIEPYAKKWQNFKTFHDKFYLDCPAVTFTYENPWSLFEIDELNVVVAGINSTMKESHLDEDHYGYGGEKQYRWFADKFAEYEQKGWFRIAVLHHNLQRGTIIDEECLRDADDFASILSAKTNLVLHGHVHVGKVTWLTQKCPVVATGSAALRKEQRPEEVPNQYQIIRIGYNELERWCRAFAPNAGQKKWVGDTHSVMGGNDWKQVELVTFEKVCGTFPAPGKNVVLPLSNFHEAPVSAIRVDQDPQQVRNDHKKIALLSANPLDDEQQYTSLLKEIKKIACPIDHYSLSINNLNNLHGYDYVIILSKVTKSKLLIETAYLCSRRISFKELEEQIGNEETAGVFIFVDQLPDSSSTVALRLPTLIIPELGKKELDGIVFQLFKKNNLSHFQKSLLVNRASFRFSPLSGKLKGDSNIRQDITPLPDNIDPKTLRDFIGRKSDLEQICRKVLALEEEGGVLAVKGSGGIGKTTTVKKIAVALARRGFFEGGINFVDCEPINDSQHFKYKVAAAFNLEEAEDLKQHLRDHHDRLSRLIILDNFETLLYLEDSAEIKMLLGLVCDYATIVITTRESLQIEGEVIFEMRQFTTDEAVRLFVSCLGPRTISPDEMAFLRQEIIETLLDNNPLAIKLITRNMPIGKNFYALKDELETDLFSKISESELQVFDDTSDLNIERKKSIYGSILYSYKRLLENEQKTFELLSLFPDGIELETFKRLTYGQKNAKCSANIELQQSMITDRVIKALENKSMIENNGGKIKLQSIVGKFAEAQLHKRSNLSRFYRNAFYHNFSFALALNDLQYHNKRRALEIFNSQQGNFLKSITYCCKFDFDSTSGNEDMIDYLSYISQLFIQISSLGGLIRELSARIDDFQGTDRKYVEALLLKAKYYDGDFDRAFAGIKQLAPMETSVTLDRNLASERRLAATALDIYLMEGEALSVAKYNARYRRAWYHYPDSLLCLGVYDQQLIETCTHQFFTFEVMVNMGLPAIEAINVYLSGLYDKAHLERMQVSYVRSKLTPVGQSEIEGLVTVNPYTRGLKGLMLAFAEEDVTRACALYQEAIDQLSHIKYYFVEALFFYAKFLRKHEVAEFDSIYSKGLDLARNHHYRFLQYRFEELLNATGIPYNPRNYPLPENESFLEYIHYLIKENKGQGVKSWCAG